MSGEGQADEDSRAGARGVSDVAGAEVAPPPLVDASVRQALVGTPGTTAGAGYTSPASSQPAPRVAHPSRIEDAPEAPEHLDPDAGPYIYRLAPASGPICGGPAITVLGYFFDPACKLELAGKPVDVIFQGAGRLSFKLPPHAPAGKVDLRVTNPDGKYQDRIWGFEYLGPPLVAAVEPDHAPIRGGQLLRVHGAAFQEGCLVQIGASSAQTRFVSPELVEILAQPHPEGRYDVTVWNPDGQQASLAAGFGYAGPPVITQLEPARGVAGSTCRVKVRGKHFEPQTTAALFEQIALRVEFESAECIHLVLPARAAGSVDLTLYNPDGQRTTRESAFEYHPAAPPRLDVLEPSRLPLGQATRLALEGAGFQPGAAVFAGQFPLELLEGSAERLVVQVPALPSVGVTDVRVINPDGQWCQLPASLQVYDPAEQLIAEAERVLAITSVEPPRGPCSGGTGVRIRGVNFSKETRVLMGGARPQSSRWVDAKLIEIVTDDREPGVVDIELRDEGAVGCVALQAFRFEAVEPAQIDRVTPNRGTASGGERLCVEGSNFLPDTRARLGGAVAQLIFKSATELELVTPPGQAGSLADLILIQPDGQRSTKPRVYLYE
ncbi:MAG: IPT/TIG domain-containing protein [Polyangiaceae bacterium]